MDFFTLLLVVVVLLWRKNSGESLELALVVVVLLWKKNSRECLELALVVVDVIVRVPTVKLFRASLRHWLYRYTSH